MDQDLATYTRKERVRIEQMANRKIHSECTLIMTAGFALVMVTLFFFAKYTFVPVAFVLEVGPTPIWILMAFGIASCCALMHYFYFGPKIAAARLLSSKFLYAHQDKMRLEREEKIQNLRSKD